MYMAFQDTGDDDILYGYYFTDRDTFIMNIGANNTRNHPTLFKTKEKAEEFIQWYTSKKKNITTIF